MDPWAAPGVKSGASPASVRRAWRAAARSHHPDRGGDATAFKAAHAAWLVLRSGTATTPARGEAEVAEAEPRGWSHLRAVRRLVELDDVDVEALDDGTTGFYGAGAVVWCSDEGLEWEGFRLPWFMIDDSIMDDAAELLRVG
jgi:hypothetical protein